MDLIIKSYELKLGRANNGRKLLSRHGGIGNIERGIKIQDDKIKVNLFHGQLAQALIIQNEICAPEKHGFITLCSIDKTSIVDWGRQIIEFNQKEGWNHISYLDMIENKFDCIKLDRINSADLCSSNYTKNDKKELLKLIPFIDYLIISDHELEALGLDSVTYLRDNLKKGLIIHSPKKIEYIGDEDISLNLNANIHSSTLGAGDLLVSLFIMSQIKGLNLYDTLTECKEKIVPLILQANEDI